MFSDQITPFLKTANTLTTQSAYELGLRQFYEWYLATYNEEPDALLLTAEEVREWRSYSDECQTVQCSHGQPAIGSCTGFGATQRPFCECEGNEES